MVAAGYAEVPAGWDAEADLLAYVRKFSAVAADCRVTLDDELRLLGSVKSDSLTASLSAGARCDLHNRAVALRAVTSHLRQHKSLRCVALTVTSVDLRVWFALREAALTRCILHGARRGAYPGTCVLLQWAAFASLFAVAKCAFESLTLRTQGYRLRATEIIRPQHNAPTPASSPRPYGFLISTTLRVD